MVDPDLNRSVLVEYVQAAGVVKTGRTHSGSLGPRTEIIERAITAGAL